MNCSDFRREVSRYVDGYLMPDEQGNFENHLKACPSCQLVTEDFQELNNLIDAADVDIPPVDLTQGIMNRIKKPSRRTTTASLMKDIVTAAAAAMIIFWLTGPAVKTMDIPRYSQGIVEVSNSIGGIFKSYVSFGSVVSDRMSQIDLTVKQRKEL